MEETKLTILHSIVLYRILDKILFLNGSDVEDPVERELPFNVKYKIQRNKDILLKDYVFYENERVKLIRSLGSGSEEVTAVPPEKMEEFRTELMKTTAMEVSHPFIKLSQDDVVSIKGDIAINCYEMDMFISFMVDDKDLKESLESIASATPDQTDTPTEE